MKKRTLSLALLASLPLFASSVELEQITISTATKAPQTIANLTANVDIITADEIKEHGFTTIADVLKTHAGFAITNNGGLGKNTSIMLRGFNTKRVLVLVDGVRYNDPTSLSGAQFPHILLENIEQIEIVKGAQSGIWGADASAGVINIITKKPTNDGISASLYAEYGSYNRLKYGLNSGYKTTAYDLTLNLERLTSDGFSAKVPTGAEVDDFEDDSYENSTANLKVGINISKQDRVEAFFDYIDSETNYDGYDKNATKAANDTQSLATLTQQFYGVSYARSEGENRTKIYYNRSDFQRVNRSAYGDSPFDGSVDEAGLNTILHYMKDATLTAGIDYKKFLHTLNVSTDYTVKNYVDKEYTNTGIFLSNSNTFNGISAGKTIFSQAMRYDDFDSFDNKFTYKIGLKHYHKHIEDFWTSFNYATAYNVPSNYQLFAPNYGNTNLKPEETKGFDITANYKGFGVTYFQNEISDMIDYVMVDPATYAGGYFNLEGTTTLKGVEVTYAGSIEPADLAYNFNYTYLNTEDNKGKALKRRPKNSANLSLDYYGIANTHLGSVISYVGEREESFKPDYDAYTLVDVSADYEVNPALTLYANITNALDESYENIYGYATAQRAFYAGFRYKLK
jgi:vitamin B12 transporter